MRHHALVLVAATLHSLTALAQMPDSSALPTSIATKVISSVRVGEEFHEIAHILAGDRVIMTVDLWYSTDRSKPHRRGYVVLDPTLPVKKPGEPCEPMKPLFVVHQGFTPLRYHSVIQQFVPAGCALTTSDADNVSDREYRLTRSGAVLLSLTCTPEGVLRPRTRTEFDQHLKHRHEKLSAKNDGAPNAAPKSRGLGVGD